MKQVCGSIEECVFGADGVCVYCERREPKAFKENDGREEDIAEEIAIEPPDSLF